MSRISMDLSGELPTSKRGNRYILNIQCATTRYTEFYALREIKTTNIADILLKNIICRYGACREIHSDQGKQFISALNRSLCDRINIQKTFSSVYYPKSNSRIEKTMYISNLALYAIANKNKGNWCSYVPSVQAAYNSSPHEATGFSPHYLVYGYDWEPPIVVTLNIPERPMPTEWNLYQEDFLDKIKFIREKAIEFNQEYQRKVNLIAGRAHILTKWGTWYTCSYRNRN